MDLRKGFFAVSDSPNRFPTASRRFLRKLVQGLEALPSPDPDEVLSLEAFDRFSRSVIETSEEVLQTIPYTESCTFTGVLVASTEAGKKGILFHTGDSRLYEVNRKTCASRSMTPSNFLMVGKSKRFSQVEKIEIPPEAMFILATDGVVDLSSEDRVGRHESLAEMATRYPVEEIPDKLVEAIDLQQATTDDLVIVALDPDQIRSCEATILLGGTEEREEKRYRKKCSQDLYEDAYVPIREQSSKRECALSVE
jgi:serine/threonine protein phosphatase PrpC